MHCEAAKVETILDSENRIRPLFIHADLVVHVIILLREISVFHSVTVKIKTYRLLLNPAVLLNIADHWTESTNITRINVVSCTQLGI